MTDYQLYKNIMNWPAYLFIVLFLFSVPTLSNGKDKQKEKKQPSTSFVYEQLSTPNPSVEAQALFRYLQNISGEKILSGQMCTQNGVNELEYIFNISGKKPALRGTDLVDEQANEMVIQNSIKWWKAGGIPLIMWHWGAPSFSEGYENSKKEIIIEKCYQEGTAEYISFWNELETKANHLETLRDANVPVLWCPFHEQNSSMFWWGKKGPEQFKKLWQTMYNYFVHERKLNNLIWVTCFSEDANSNWFPGNNFVDIIGASSYQDNTTPQHDMFGKAKSITTGELSPIAYNECATMPNPDECRETNTMWSWWLQRHDSYLTNINKQHLISVYQHKLILTLDELPNIVNDYKNETVKREMKYKSKPSFSKFKGYSIGAKSGNLSLNNNILEIEAKGEDIQGKKDKVYFAFRQIEGDFDVSVQVLSLSPVHLNTMAGIMARADLGKSSRHVFFHVFPDNNPKINNPGGCELKYRTKQSKETMAIYPNSKIARNNFNVDFPNTWIRLKRRGNIFKSYISHDNSNWHIYSVHVQEMPKSLMVGLAVSSQNAQKSAKAKFGSMELTWE